MSVAWRRRPAYQWRGVLGSTSVQVILLIIGLGTPLAAALLHASYVRIIGPRSAFLSLWIIETAVIAGTAVLLFSVDASISAEGWVVAVILSLSLLFCYLLSFMGIVHDSPTLAFVNFVMDFGPAGMPRGKVDDFVAAHPFIGSRLQAMLDAGFLRSEGTRIALGGKTGMLLRLALRYQRLSGHGRQSG